MFTTSSSFVSWGLRFMIRDLGLGCEDNSLVNPDLHNLHFQAVAIIFHANAMLCLDMASWAKWYAQRGIHALCITMGGYAESELGKISMTELSTYFDAQVSPSRLFPPLACIPLSLMSPSRLYPQTSVSLQNY